MEESIDISAENSTKRRNFFKEDKYNEIKAIHLLKRKVKTKKFISFSIIY